jgi:glycosyltransferase involved in cell wall biosynthesis
MRLPVICSRITGNIDIITHNQTGLIFECGSEEQMLNHLQYAMIHPEHMNSMAIQLQKDIAENYWQENIWQNMLEAYKTLVH